MKLAKYIEEYGYRAPWFAKKLGVSHGTLWYWMSGRRRPSNMAMQVIKQHTQGMVTEKDWEPEQLEEKEFKNDREEQILEKMNPEKKDEN